jgi:hypothetical protein
MDFCGDEYHDDENDARGVAPVAPVDHDAVLDALLADAEYRYADRLAGDR